jgi:2-hydroxyacyl-CoA lyase 1
MQINVLLSVGVEAAYARAEAEVAELLQQTNIPFLTAPMAKGIVRDDSPLSVSAARSLALQIASLMLLPF